MSKNTNWSQVKINHLDIINNLINLFKSGRSGHIEKRNNTFEDVSHPITKVRDFTIWEYSAMWNPSNKNLPTVNSVEWDLYFNYIPCFSTKEARENYINKGILHKDLSFGMGIQTPVKKSDLKILFPDREYGTCNYTWYVKDRGIIIDDSIKECYVVIMDDEVFDESLFLEKLEENINYIKENPLNNLI